MNPVDIFKYYAETNVVCILLFAIMLVHDVTGVDRQEKRIKFDFALSAFMLYFAVDIFWAAVKYGVIGASQNVAAIFNMLTFVCMAAITYTWLRYVMSIELVPSRNKTSIRIFLLLPLLISMIVLVALWFADPEILFDISGPQIKPNLTFYVFLIVVPTVYIVSIMVAAMRRFKEETNPIEKRKHFYIGFFPLAVVLGGTVQTLFFPDLPIFCQCSAALMLIFYLRSMDTQISTDALTGLNNRGQLMRYVSIKTNVYPEGRMTYLVMFDVNNFKHINDTYGHAEGDRALVLVAEALRNAVKGREVPGFLGRYGGDEFILVAHPVHKEEMELLLEDIRSRIEAAAKANSLPYRLTVGAGCDELQQGGQDTFQKCLQRADKKLYLDKEYRKLHEAAEAAE